jgi:hypothetical protein
MGMDGIGGVGALNVSSQTRVTRPQSETVDVNTGSTAGQQQVQVFVGYVQIHRLTSLA